MTRKQVMQFGKGMAFCSPWLIGFLVFTLIPVGLSLYYSFCDFSLLQSPAYIGWDNYSELLNDKEVFWKTMRNTLYFAAMALPSGMLVSLGLALMLNVRVKGQSIYRTIIFLPSLVPVVANSMLWLWLFNARSGLFNHVLRSVGVEGTLSMSWLSRLLGIDPTNVEKAIRDFALPPQWLGDDRLAMPSLVFMGLWGVGNTVVIYLAGLQDVPVELHEAAEIDGAGVWQRLWHVTLPMISPVIFFNLIMAIIGTLQVFTGPYIMTNGGPDRATYFFTMFLYDNAFTYLKMGMASAMAWIQLLIVLLLTAIAFWSSKRWVHYQGK